MFKLFAYKCITCELWHNAHFVDYLTLQIEHYRVWYSWVV